MKVLFFTTAIEHTTFRKTARMLEKEGVEVHIIGFTRNNYPYIEDGLSVQSLGQLNHGNYIKRLFTLLRFIKTLRKEALNYDIVYTFTADTLFISLLALSFMRKEFVYQIQDIRPIYFGNSFKSKVARVFEKSLMKRIKLLVVSSINFYEGFFKVKYDFPKNKVLVIENKLEKTPNVLQTKKTINSKITIGYFGVMRCQRSWLILKKLMDNHKSRFNLYMRGKTIAIPNLEEVLENTTNIEYDGMYKSPNDLRELYSRVDIVWAAYPFSVNNKEGNWKYARTIRFYEACAFGKPVIVQKGTPQAKEVEKHKIGIVIDMNSIKDTVDILSSITFDLIDEWKINISKLPISYYIHQDEYSILLAKIKE